MPPQKANSLLYNWQNSIIRQPLCLRRQSLLLNHARLPAHRTLIAAPGPNSGPLMSRRSDRALPPIPSSWRVWGPTLPIFVIILTVSALGIFNYQKTSSPIVAATLYSLRTSEVGRRELGDEIYFRDMWPWIWGEMNQLHGRVDIHFGVKGTKGRGMMRFKSERRGRMGKFETKEWSLETEDGRKIQLLDEGRADPFKETPSEAEATG
ncbi:MAG: hypothetical protein Q9161_008219 [Pseudevernia consocians]